jgi:hypothetical protein
MKNPTNDMRNSLESIFCLEEIKEDIFEANENKSSSSDGLSFQFYQKYWDINDDTIS